MSWSFRRLWWLSAALTSWWPETRLRRLVAERAIGPAHEAHEQLEVTAQAIYQARAGDYALFDRSRRRLGLELQPLGRGMLGRELARNAAELRLLVQAVESASESRCARGMCLGRWAARRSDAQERGPREASRWRLL
jgi:hypothetical protein